jgi:hypothetical protein
MKTEVLILRRKFSLNSCQNLLSFNHEGSGKGFIGQQLLRLCTLEERRHQLDMIHTFKILKGVDNVNKSTWFTPASEGQVRVTRMAADPLNVRQQPSRLDISSIYKSSGWMEQSADRHKK